jgi:hypothetical protein
MHPIGWLPKLRIKNKPEKALLPGEYVKSPKMYPNHFLPKLVDDSHCGKK